MTEVTAKLRTRSRLGAVLATLAAVWAMHGAADAHARPYTVVSCDSAAAFGYNAGAWAPYANAGRAYQACPSNGGFTAGVSNRLTDAPYTAFHHSGHAFNAPPGTTITHLRWGGRIARDNCRWGSFIRAVPSGASVIGYPNDRFCGATDFDNRTSPLTMGVPPGTTRLEQLVICGASQCPAGATLHSQTLEVTIEDPEAPSVSLSGPLVSGGWVSGRAGRPYVDVGATDHSGVQMIETGFGDRAPRQTYACDWSQPRPCNGHATTSAVPSVADLADGTHTLSVSAVDAAGNNATVTRSVKVDNTPPDPVLPEIAGGTGWRRINGFKASWSNPSNSAAPIVRAHWKLCAPNGTCPWRGHRAAQEVHELPNLLAPGPGEFRLHIWLEDAAGNQREANAPLSVPLRFDPEAPELAFSPLDPNDPLRVAVNAVDRHSGLAGGEIEMRATGSETWHGLRTERQGSQLVGYVDDERFRTGAYEFRARAVDQAGNEASTGKRADGSAARLRLPARIETRLVVGMPRQGRRRHGGRTRVGQRLDADVVARHGRALRLAGRLTNADGQPIDAATIEALQANADGEVLPIGLATTGLDGRFRYVLRATRSRNVLFRYAGSRRIGADTATFRMRVPAASSIDVDRPKVRNGQAVMFSGRVTTRPLPANGKLIEMQAHFRGRWRTFSTVRTDRTGRWRFPYRFGATLGRVVYRFRVRLPSEGGYPFASGRSRTARVVVIGP